MGLTVLDAGVVIAVLDRRDAHHAAAVNAFGDARDRGDELVLPASAYAECLVSPSRRGAEAVMVVDRFLDALPVRVEPVSRAVAGSAAQLRSRHAAALRLPDALVVATAIVLGAGRVITTDGGWPEIPVRVEVLGKAG